mgnify:CR=1 FL=1
MFSISLIIISYEFSRILFVVTWFNREFVEFKTHVSSVDAGVTYLIKKNLQLEFSFGTGINHTMNYMAIGCSINISKAPENI